APRFRSLPDVEAATFDAIVQRVCPCLLIAHSASAGPALAVAERSDLVKAVIAVEPASVPENRSREVPALVIWGDFLDPRQTQPSWDEEVAASRRYVQARPRATFMDLPALGVRGNSHLLMSDMNSDRVAGLIDEWIRRHGF